MSPHYGSTKKNLARIIINIFNRSEVALLAASQKILNVTAFARLIKPQVEQLANKQVSLKTIAMTISRFLKNNPTQFFCT